MSSRDGTDLFRLAATIDLANIQVNPAPMGDLNGLNF
jgi:hypothetical protein